MVRTAAANCGNQHSGQASGISSGHGAPRRDLMISVNSEGFIAHWRTLKGNTNLLTVL